MSLESTLGKRDWLSRNEDNIKRILPDTWTLLDNLNVLKLGMGLKLAGIDWRSPEELVKVMVFLERIGFLERRNGYQVRANPSRVMPKL